jgi:hypothetical protein
MPNFSKSTSNSLQAAKVSRAKLNLKAQNIYDRTLLKP